MEFGVQTDSASMHDIGVSFSSPCNAHTQTPFNAETQTDLRMGMLCMVCAAASHKKERKKPKSEHKKRRTQSYSHHGPKQVCIACHKLQSASFSFPCSYSMKQKRTYLKQSRLMTLAPKQTSTEAQKVNKSMKLFRAKQAIK